MIIQRKRGLNSLLLVSQTGLIILVFLLCAAGTFRFVTTAAGGSASHYGIYILTIMIGLFLESVQRDQAGLPLGYFEDGILKQHQLSLRQTFFAIGTLFVYLVLAKDAQISRTFLFICFPMFYLTFLISNRLMARRLAKYLFKGVRKGRVLLVGPVARASSLRKWLETRRIYGMETIGIIHDHPDQQTAKRNFPYLGHLSDVGRVIREEGITQVIILELPETDDAYLKLVSVLEGQGVRFLILNNLQEKLHHPVSYLEDEGHHFISLRKEPLENPLNRFLKRLLDIAIALPVVVIILPLVCLVVWLIQRLFSPGALFFRQIRAGLQNNTFEILKFRTMHEGPHDGSVQASVNDSRIYRGGRILRKLSIDELPQFWNVLKGDMSVVGPRPHLMEHNEKFARLIAHFPIRKAVKPGITGLAQVRGYRGEVQSATAISKRLESDIEYIENWRMTLDMVIIAKTFFQMFKPPETAY